MRFRTNSIVMTHDYVREAASAAVALGIDFNKEKFTLADLARGIEVEYEHGRSLSAAQCFSRPDTNVTNDDMLATAKIALAHLYERREGRGPGRCGIRDTQYDYYDGLELVETAPVGYWRGTSPNSYWRDKTIGIFVVVALVVIAATLLVDNFSIIHLTKISRTVLLAVSIAGGLFLAIRWK
jgi:hypothetical protein